ncbi:STAS domain-containing protein [Streptomyces sp. BH105]|uniref:STAS domain-containing protein n=1 Tax=Streptomyces sp. BH105 TaxID=3410408 RepID=UPI003CF5AC57
MSNDQERPSGPDTSPKAGAPVDAFDLVRQLDRVVDTHKPTPNAIKGVKALWDWMQEEPSPVGPLHTWGPETLALIGELDLECAGRVGDELYAALESGTGDLVLNLRGLTSFDARGFAVLVAAHNRARGLGRRLVLQDAPRILTGFLKASRMEHLLDAADSASEHEPEQQGSGESSTALPWRVVRQDRDGNNRYRVGRYVTRAEAERVAVALGNAGGTHVYAVEQAHERSGAVHDAGR